MADGDKTTGFFAGKIDAISALTTFLAQQFMYCMQFLTAEAELSEATP